MKQKANKCFGELKAELKKQIIFLRTAKVKARDDFDFTEFKNPFKQESFKEGFLWFANNLATIDSKLGMLDTVGVEITYTKKF